MRSFASIAVLLSLLAAGTAHASKSTRRFGLIAGANDGGEGRALLRYAGSDAAAMARVLGELGGVDAHDRLLLLDPDRASLQHGFKSIAQRLQEASADGSRVEVFFYYSGHSDEEGLLLGHERFGYGELRDALDRLPAEVRVAILDSCASGSFTRRKGGVVRPAFLVDASSSVKGHAFLTASSADEAAQESDRIGASFFTHHLVSGLRGAADTTGSGKVTLNEAYAYAFRETLAQTERTQGGAQHPAYEMELVGSGDLVMTDLRATSAGLVLGEELSGRVFVRDADGNLVVEVRKQPAAPVELGLGPGSYTVTLDEGRKLYASEITLAEGKRATLARSQLRPVGPEATVRRGSTDVDADYEVVPFDATIMRIGKPSRPTLNHFGLHLLAGRASRLDGAQLSMGVAWIDEEVDGVQASIVGNYAGGDLHGAQLSVGANQVDGDSSGAQLTVGYNQVDGNMQHVQSAVYANNVGGRVDGVQLAVGANVAGSEVSGGQFAVGGNYAGSRVEGVQAAVGLNLAIGSEGEGVESDGSGGGSIATVDGAQLAVGANIAAGSIQGTQVSVGANVVGGAADGAQMAVGANVVGGAADGMQAAVGANVVGGAADGMQAAVGANVVGGAADGMQVAVGANVTGGAVRGVQMAVGGNIAGESVDGAQVATGFSVAPAVDGFQLSTINVAGNVDGAQVGLLNLSGGATDVQIGLVNYADEADVSIGLLTFTRKGRLDLEAWASDVNAVNLSLHTGARYTYGVLTAGWSPGADRASTGWSAGLGLGTRLETNLTPLDFVNVDLTSNAYFDGTDWNRSLFVLRAGLGWQFSSGVALVVGPTLNLQAEWGDRRDVKLSQIRGAKLSDEVRLWPGFFAGFQI